MAAPNRGVRVAGLSNDEHGEILALAGEVAGVRAVMARHIDGSTAEIFKALGSGKPG